jgi:competence protein ComFC
MDKVISIFFPVKCVICGVEGRVVCIGCRNRIEILKDSYCIVCDKKSSNGMTHRDCFRKGVPSQLITIFNYRSVVRDIIRKSKYYKKEFSAFKFLILYGANLLDESLRSTLRGYFLLSVPPNPKNYKKRGFNQADLILKEVSKRLKLQVVNGLLSRERKSSSQYSYNRYDRFKAVKGAFRLRDGVSGLGGKRFLIVDDIITSGATLLEMSKVLYVNGAEDVRCLTISKKNKEFL